MEVALNEKFVETFGLNVKLSKFEKMCFKSIGSMGKFTAQNEVFPLTGVLLENVEGRDNAIKR